MKKGVRQPSSLFFLECSIVLIIFSLASTVIIRCFVKADTIRNHSRDTIKAVHISVQLAESIKANPQPLIEETSFYYDIEENQVALLEKEGFIVTLIPKVVQYQEGELVTTSIQVEKRNHNSQEVLYTLKVANYYITQKK